MYESLEQIAKDIARCRLCKLCRMRKNPVPGEGSEKAEVMFIGEAPGQREDEMGRPFVGAAGNLLTQLIKEKLGLDRSQVYITNVLKCRPPGNRDPELEEIEACGKYLEWQIALIKPKVIVTLGRFSTSYVLWMAGVVKRGTIVQISRYRGKPMRLTLKLPTGETLDVVLFPTYHPAAALYKPPLRRLLEKDFEEIKKILSGKRKESQSTLEEFLEGE